eukprot:360065_1
MSAVSNDEEFKSDGFNTGDLGSWVQMAQNPAVKAKDFFDRLSNYWNMCIATSGMLSGFAFVVASRTFAFQHDADLTTTLFSICIVTSLMFGLSSTFIGLILFGYLNVCGPLFSKWFVRRYPYMPDVPLVLLFVSIFFMLVSICVAVRGFYGNTVFYVTVGEATCVLAGTFVIYWRVGNTANNRIIEYTAEMQKLSKKTDTNTDIDVIQEDIAGNIVETMQKNKTFYR